MFGFPITIQEKNYQSQQIRISKGKTMDLKYRKPKFKKVKKRNMNLRLMEERKGK